MRNNRTFWLAFTLTTTFCAVLLTDMQPAQAQSSRILARSQFRRTVDPSPEGPVGNLLLVEEANGQQILRADIRKLDETDLSLQISTNYYFDGTNSPVAYVAPLNRTGAQLGNWNSKITGSGGAPPQLQLLGVANLTDLVNLRSFDVGNPGSTNIYGGTNFVECTQIVSNNITYVTCTTNVYGGVTNIYVNAFIWAPVPPLVSNPSIFNFRVKGHLTTNNLVIPPNPHAKGTMLMTYNGTQGRSLFDFRVNSMVKGQSYALWVSDGGTNWNAGLFEFLGTSGGADAKFRRDTDKGDPLPIQAPSTADLTNRVFQVRDGFGIVHLEGFFP